MIVECPQCSCHYTGDNLQNKVVSAAQSGGSLTVICPSCEQWLGLPQYRAMLSNPVSAEEKATTKKLYWEVAKAKDALTGPVQINAPQAPTKDEGSIFDSLGVPTAPSSSNNDSNYGSSYGGGGGSVFDGHDQGGGYGQSSGYGQNAGYDQSGYDQPSGYGQAGGYDQGYGYPEPYGEQQGAQTKHIIMIVGGLLGLITMCVVGALFLPSLLFKQDEAGIAKNKNQVQNNSGKSTRQSIRTQAPKTVGPMNKSVDQLIADLQSGDSSLRTEALHQFYFFRDPSDEKERKAVAAQLKQIILSEKQLQQSRIDHELIESLKKWSGPEQITWLNTAIKETTNDRVRGQLVEVLLPMKDIATAPGLASQFSNYSVRRAFKEFGPKSAPHVLPYINHPDYSMRRDSRELITDWRLDEQSVEQCIKDLSIESKVEVVAEWIASWDFDLEAEKRIQIAKALEEVLDRVGGKVSRNVLTALGKYGRVPESADKVVALLNQESMREERVAFEAVAKLNSPSTIPILVELLSDSSKGRYAEKSLVEMSPEPVAKAILPAFNSANRDQRRKARGILTRLKVEKSLVFAQCAEDLKNKPGTELNFVMEWLRDQEFSEEDHEVVAESFNLAFANMQRVVVDNSEIITMIKVAEKWGNEETAKLIAPILRNTEDSSVYRAAATTLAEIKSPETFEAIAEGLKNEDGSIQMWTRNALIKIGSDAEQAVIPFVRDTDRRVRTNAYQILGEIGGLEASRVLASRIEVATKSNEVSDKMMAQRAFDAILARGIDVNDVGRPDGPILRDWTDSSGEKTIQGKMIGFDSGELQLEVDGETFTMELSRLSKDDQEYARDELRRRRKAERENR